MPRSVMTMPPGWTEKDGEVGRGAFGEGKRGKRRALVEGISRERDERMRSRSGVFDVTSWWM
jgi:hypothetical protein